MLRFGATLLLLQNHQRLIKLRIPFANLFAQDGNLRVLAAQTQHRGPRNIRVVQVAGNQPAQIVGVFPRSAAAACMQQESDAIHVFKKRRASWSRVFSACLSALDVFSASFLVEPRQFRHLLPINLRRRETQFLLERLLQDSDVSVLAKH